MKENTTLLDRALVEFATLLAPLSRLRSPYAVVGLLRELGWELPTYGAFQNGFGSLRDSVEGLLSELERLGEVTTSNDNAYVLVSLQRSVKSIVAMITEAGGVRKEIEQELEEHGQFLDESGIASEELARRLLDYLVVSHLQVRLPQLFAVLKFVGVVGIEDVTPSRPWEPRGIGQSYPLRRVYWRRIHDLLVDPLDVGAALYSAQEAGEWAITLILENLEELFRSFMLPAGVYPKDLAPEVEGVAPAVKELELRIPLLQGGGWPDAYYECGLNISQSGAGIALVPYLFGAASISEAVGEEWEVSLRGTASLDSGFGLILRPPNEVEVDQPNPGDSRVEVSIRQRTGTNVPTVIFGSMEGSQLSIAGGSFTFLAAGGGSEGKFEVGMDVEGLKVVIDLAKGDGFLQSVLAGQRIENVFDLKVGLSRENGLHFEGSGGREIILPVHRDAGPIRFDSVFVSLQVGTDIDIALATSFSTSFGPISARIDRIGMSIPIRFPENRHGNLGPVDLPGIGFVPPTGAGVSIDASAIEGGGFLEFDDANKRYAGILQLTAGELELVGIGLISTRMPDGSDGFSLLITIVGKFPSPIQLPYGFTLSGIGGLIALNRTMEVEVLRSGLRAGTLSSILFPEDPIANAARIISDLRAVFPPAKDRFVVGPMIKLGWGTPTIVEADLGIFIEFPGPKQIVLLGQINVALPQKDHALIELHLDVLGVINFEAETLSIDATLYDSRILQYALSGDAAVRFSWGASPTLALSMGGFHPRYAPPPAFPALRRMTMDMSRGRDLQLYCLAYQAITANTVQFGASMVLLARKHGARLEGTLTFDTLIYLSPFSFVVDIEGNVVARYRGRRLASVLLRMQLSGPTPWNVRGRAEFSVLCWDVTVRFNETWGSREQLEIAPIDPWPLLKDALERDESWGARLPSGVTAVETLASRSSEEESPQPLLVHPMGSLEVRQIVLPLEIKLQKVGSAPLEEPTSFSIDRVTLVSMGPDGSSGGTIVEEDIAVVADVEEDFARAQFVNLSDSERLTLPSFEKMKAGVVLGGDRIAFGNAVPSTGGEYETILIHEDRTSSEVVLGDERIVFASSVSSTGVELGVDPTSSNFGLEAVMATVAPTTSADTLRSELAASAAARCALRKSGRRKYAVADKRKALKVLKEGFQVVNADTGNPVLMPEVTKEQETKEQVTKEQETREQATKEMGRLQVEQALADYIARKPGLAGRLRVTSVGGIAR